METEWAVSVSATGRTCSACSMPQCLPGYFNHSHYLLGSWRHIAFAAFGTKREEGWWENPVKCYQGVAIITEPYTGQMSSCPSSPPEGSCYTWQTLGGDLAIPFPLRGPASSPKVKIQNVFVSQLFAYFKFLSQDSYILSTLLPLALCFLCLPLFCEQSCKESLH